MTTHKVGPEVSVKVSNPKMMFENIKEIAILRLGKVINSKFDFIMSFDKCEYTKLELLSKNIFNWFTEDFIKRRQLPNCVWIDVLKKYSENQCLEKFKIQNDLKEIKRFLNLILQKLTQNHEIIWKALRETERYFNIFQFLQDEQILLASRLQDNELRYNARLLAKRHTRQQLILWGIEETKLNAQTWDPIQMRYEINWYQNNAEQIHYKNIFLENDIQQEITKYKLKILTEELSGDNICDTYYTLAEQYKRYIEALQNRYDNEVDDIDNQINYTQLQMSKLIEKEIFFKEQIVKYHEEIKIFLEKVEKERNEQEMKRLKLEEETRVQQLERRKNKKNIKKLKFNK